MKWGPNLEKGSSDKEIEENPEFEFRKARDEIRNKSRQGGIARLAP
jgi:hypothetical protein